MRKGKIAEYWFRAVPLRIVDADTIKVDVDLGLRVKKGEALRLYGIDAPEKDDKNPRIRAHALRAIRRAVQVIDVHAGPENRPPLVAAATNLGRPLRIRTFKPYVDDSRGRWCAIVYCWQAIEPPEWDTVDGWLDLNADLVARGLARPYDGRRARVPWKSEDCPPVDAP